MTFPDVFMGVFAAISLLIAFIFAVCYPPTWVYKKTESDFWAVITLMVSFSAAVAAVHQLVT